MEHILEHIHANRADANGQSDDFDQHKLQQSDEDNKDAPDSEAEGEADPSQPSKQKRLQIMVFSATLTLPLHLRKRLNKSKPVLALYSTTQQQQLCCSVWFVKLSYLTGCCDVCCKHLNNSKPGHGTCVSLLFAVTDKLAAFAIIYLTLFEAIWSVLDNSATATLLFCVIYEGLSYLTGCCGVCCFLIESKGLFGYLV